ncbi:MAG: D-aminoacyl-tRNA deacylase [Phycisphaerae bacterium]
MRALLQRVSEAAVTVEGRVTGQIGPGLLVYTGVARSDTPTDARILAAKVANLRIFEDDADKLNLSVMDVGGEILAISNFTLQADTRKGRRPAFVNAAVGEQALPLYDAFTAALRREGVRVAEGVFAAHMTIHSVADGPVNVVVDVPVG